MLKALQERWEKERELVTKIRELRGKLEAGHAANGTGRGGGHVFRSTQVGAAGP